MKKTIIVLLTFISGMVAAQDEAQFCDALNKMLRDAPNYFKNIEDTSHSRGDLNYGIDARFNKCTVSVPFGLTVEVRHIKADDVACIISFPIFGSAEAAKKAGDKIVAQIKVCFPSYYVSQEASFARDTNTYFGVPYDDGFGGPLINVSRPFPKMVAENEVKIIVYSGKPMHYIPITTEAADDQFAKDIKTVFADTYGGFKTVKSTPRDNKGRMYYSSFDVVPLPTGAISFIEEDKSTFWGNTKSNAFCLFLENADYNDALLTYSEKVSKIKSVMGNKFAFSNERPDSSIYISPAAVQVTVFGPKPKNKKAYMRSVSEITVEMIKSEGDKYSVGVRFFKDGF